MSVSLKTHLIINGDRQENLSPEELISKLRNYTPDPEVPEITIRGKIVIESEMHHSIPLVADIKPKDYYAVIAIYATQLEYGVKEIREDIQALAIS